MYLIKVPTSVASSELKNVEIDLSTNSPERVQFGNTKFSPIVSKNKSGPTAMILPDKKGKQFPALVDVKGIVTLRESIKVPLIPKIDIPEPYKVPPPEDPVLRHPIYGLVSQEESNKMPLEDNVKIKEEITDSLENVLPTEIVPEKKRKSMDTMENILPDENTSAKKKKKKKIKREGQ